MDGKTFGLQLDEASLIKSREVAGSVIIQVWWGGTTWQVYEISGSVLSEGEAHTISNDKGYPVGRDEMRRAMVKQFHYIRWDRLCEEDKERFDGADEYVEQMISAIEEDY